MNLDTFFFKLFGVVAPIFIGVMHLVTHFLQLESPQIRQHLSATISILGQDQAYWNTWGITSIMMGWAFIVIGMQNILMLRLKQDNQVPSIAFVIMSIYLIGVVYVGYRFDAIPQLFLGGFALLIFILIIIKRLIKKPSEKSPNI